MKIKSVILSALLLTGSAFAQTNNNNETTKAVIPIFSEVISFKMPVDFVGNQQSTKEGFMFEAIPKGQTLDDWKQMITITGQKDLAMPENFKLENIVGMFFKGYKEGCPKSFSGGKIDAIGNIDGHKNVTLLLRCGSQKKGNTEYSETTVINFIQGKKDFYTIQYAERTPPAKAIDQNTIDYFAKKDLSLFPITFCDYVEGKNPLLACENKK